MPNSARPFQAFNCKIQQRFLLILSILSDCMVCTIVWERALVSGVSHVGHRPKNGLIRIHISIRNMALLTKVNVINNVKGQFGHQINQSGSNELISKVDSEILDKFPSCSSLLLKRKVN